MMSNMLNHNKPLGSKITVYIVVCLIPPHPLFPSNREFIYQAAVLLLAFKFKFDKLVNTALDRYFI